MVWMGVSIGGADTGCSAIRDTVGGIESVGAREFSWLFKRNTRVLLQKTLRP